MITRRQRYAIALANEPSSGRAKNLLFQFSKRHEYRSFRKELDRLKIPTVEQEMERTHDKRRDHDRTSCWVTAQDEKYAKFIVNLARLHHGAWMKSVEAPRSE